MNLNELFTQRANLCQEATAHLQLCADVLQLHGRGPEAKCARASADLIASLVEMLPTHADVGQANLASFIDTIVPINAPNGIGDSVIWVALHATLQTALCDEWTRLSSLLLKNATLIAAHRVA